MLRALLVVVVMLAFVAADASAGGFLKYDGIEGESTDKEHQGWNDLIAWNWGMERSSAVGGGSTRGSGRAVFKDLSFTRVIDSATPAFMKHFAEGTRVGEAILDLPNHDDRAGGLRIILTNVRVRSVHIGEKADDGVHREKVTLNFTEFKVIYVGGGRTTEFGWDIRNGTAL